LEDEATVRLSLTRGGEYAVRILMHLGTLEPGTRVTSGRLAGECDVPAGNVPTIVNRLSRAGILVCAPGRGGGCALARYAEDITILEIIETMDGQLEVPTCLLDSRRCDDKDQNCALHHHWQHARLGLIECLADVSLAKAVEREAEIAALGGA
jgi:Rrf2 family protein